MSVVTTVYWGTQTLCHVMYTTMPRCSQDVRSYYMVYLDTLTYTVYMYMYTAMMPSRNAPGISVVTMVYLNTLTYTMYMYTAIPGWSGDVHSYYGVLGYSDTYCVHVYCHPRMLPGCSSYYGVIGRYYRCLYPGIIHG